MTLTNTNKRREYLEIYRDGLLNDTLPFWFPRAIDQQCGGYFTSFSRDGTLLQTDKSVWFQGRIAWTLANLYNSVEPKAEWLRDAQVGIDFIEKHCFDSDGRMFFSVTQDGKPLRKRRYFFSEMFAIVAMAAVAKASQDDAMARRALALFAQTLTSLRTANPLSAKTIVATRATKGLAIPMILLVTAQELRKTISDPLIDRTITESIEEIERDFLRDDFACVLETVGVNGEFIDTFEGRMVCPGHSLEAGWFILEEARLQNNDPHLIELGCKIIDLSFQIGWDSQFGGMLYYRDCKGLPCSEYWHDMKFWWPHNEAIIATLLAWQLTGRAHYARWHQQIHDWSYAHFPDPVFGEWFGYLHRDGTVSTKLKGNMWKGPFHLPRMQWYCWKRLEEM
ncbi:MAG: AGE family epimerase/isomerase [Thermoguttaceae bacterium]